MIFLMTLSGKLRIGAGSHPAVAIENDAAERVYGRSQLILSCSCFWLGVMETICDQCKMTRTTPQAAPNQRPANTVMPMPNAGPRLRGLPKYARAYQILASSQIPPPMAAPRSPMKTAYNHSAGSIKTAFSKVFIWTR